MDLRQFNPSPSQVDEACARLHYQPFVIDEDRQCGVGYSWMHSADPTQDHYNVFRFDRRLVPPEIWQMASDANRRLAAMYDGFAQAIATVARGGSYLDIGCNTGYLPVSVSRAGAEFSLGIDREDFSDSVRLLNAITGSSACFQQGVYNPETSWLITANGPLPRPSFDVVGSMAVMCHMPDPLHFLRALASLAGRAVFLWSGFIDSPELLIRYNAEQKFFMYNRFPNRFDDGTAISLGLLFHSMRELGFTRHDEIAHRSDWLPADWHELHIPHYQRFRAFLFYRD